MIPEAVAFELHEGARPGHAVPAALLKLVTDLDAGEREALALALSHPGCLLLLDDGRARRYAALLRLAFTGTLGVLIRAEQRGLVRSRRRTRR